ncbi:MAG: glycosyltransferase [Patescibacteria group bacterium]
MKKKIIFFIPTLNEGGGERVVSELSLNLPDSVERIILLFKNEVFYPYKGKLISLNIPLFNNVFFRIYYFFVAVWRFKKIIKKESPDLVISFGAPANIINVLFNKKAILRIDTFLSSLPSKTYKILAKILFKKALNIICVSKVSAKDLAENFNVKKEKIKVIYNLIDTKKIKELSLAPIKADFEKIFNNPAIITIGRLANGKNHLRLVKIFKEIKKDIKNAKLVILGTGKLEPEIKKAIKDFGLKEDIHLLGWQKNPFNFLAKAKLFVLPSSREGLPCSILEAMACGLPVISADCKAGPREILAPDTSIAEEADNIEYAEFGILTPVFEKENSQDENYLTKNEEIFKKAITEVLINKNLSDNLNKKSLQRANDFDIIKIIKEWSFLYDK